MQTWLVYDYAVPYLLRKHGYLCTRQNIAGFASNYYTTDCPIPMNGEYLLPDGTVIQGCSGVELRIKGRLETEPMISLD